LVGEAHVEKDDVRTDVCGRVYGLLSVVAIGDRGAGKLKEASNTRCCRVVIIHYEH
jgi:hypothetical protein